MDEQKKNEAMQTIFLGPAGASELSQPKEQQKTTKKIKPLVWWLAAGGVLIILAALWLGTGWSDKNDYNQGQWQAVFLDNGQVYFGHVMRENEDKLILREIYYPQKPVILQTENDQQPNDFTIVKFGKEIYGMEDEMIINRNNVLYVANIKEESKIVAAIKKYQEKK